MSLLNNFGHYQSWGRYPKETPKEAVPLYWRSELPDLAAFKESLLAYGYGRSYGDSCLNADGVLLDSSLLRRFIAFDRENGIIRCEAGVQLADVLEVIVPEGWFVPVSPGTKFVSVAGAVANDVHGKNHYSAGTFGCHVTQFELLRSDGQRFICSPTQNVELFRATIGGLGLTGLILWVEFKLKKIPSPFILAENIRFSSLDEYFEVAAESDKNFVYTVSWTDCITSGKEMGRGIYTRGNFYNPGVKATPPLKKGLKLLAPFDMPSFLLNPMSMYSFNLALYYKQVRKRSQKITHYNPFFYPLDSVVDWNRMYGLPGFLQYQFVVPDNDNHYAIKEIYRRITASGQGSFLAVLKNFGPIKSPGMLSFPSEGVTLALDFAFKGQKTLDLLNDLDSVVRDAGGRFYPAKDARMSPEDFQESYPNWQEFAKYVDPHFSSSFWRRVTEPLTQTEQHEKLHLVGSRNGTK